MTGLNSLLQLSAHQSKLMKQGQKYNSIADYNVQKTIRYYKDAINSSKNPQESQNLAASLESFLSKYNMGLGEVGGLNLAQAPTALPGLAAGAPKAGAAPAGGLPKEEGKKVIADVSAEFGIDVKARGTKKVWKERAKTDPNITVEGEILTINSKQHGVVKIQMGGDGEINGGDDVVLSTGGQAAGNALTNGLGAINNAAPNANPLAPNAAGQLGQVAAQQGAKVTCPVCGGKGCPTCGGTGKIDQAPQQAKDPMAQQLAYAQGVDPMAAATGANAATPLNFNQQEIQNLVAALLFNSVYYMDQNTPKTDQMDFMKVMLGQPVAAA